VDITSFDFQQCKPNLEAELRTTKVIGAYRAQGALRCEALFKELEEEFEIVGLELVRVKLEGGELVKEEDIVCSQLHGMKEGVGMSFWPTPIMHPTTYM
jgi:hypothetical protein